jgi:hypothetical protein
MELEAVIIQFRGVIILLWVTTMPSSMLIVTK